MTDPERSLVLLDVARKEGALSETSLLALKKVGPRGLALGSQIHQYKGDDVLLVATLIDDSGSLNVATEAVRIGHNAVIQALLDSEKPSAIWFHTRYLNGYVLNPWNPLEKAKRMDRGNYQAVGGTPLYDETAVILGSTIVNAEEFRNNWVKPHTATLLVTDGQDMDSKLQTSSSVNSIITDMYSTGIHIIAAMGIYNGTTDFRKIFIEMGVHDNLILTPGSTPDEIRKAFGLFGRMASSATDSEHFEDIVKGGFLALPPG